MLIYYSKPSVDIIKEIRHIMKNDKVLFDRQHKRSRTLLIYRDRKECILCERKIRGEFFKHRNLDFIICSTCGHVQTKALPSENYPGIKFKTIYPKLNFSGFQDKKKRIYKPKLDWIIDSLKRFGFSKTKITNSRWVEIGCGAGYFLSCLQDNGIKDFFGFDAEKELINIADKHIKGGKAKYYNGNLTDIFKLFPSDIYVSFFVLEHINYIHHFFLKMRSLPKGIIFVFSIPVFGLSCLLEGIFKNNFGRNLECALHTQLYTDYSIKYAMRLANFKIISQWFFGEDAVDFNRFIITNLSKNYSKKMIAYVEERLLKIQDPFQAILDRQCFSDQRHIIAIKE